MGKKIAIAKSFCSERLPAITKHTRFVGDEPAGKCPKLTPGLWHWGTSLRAATLSSSSSVEVEDWFLADSVG